MTDGRVVTVEMVFKRRALAKRDARAQLDRQHDDELGQARLALPPPVGSIPDSPDLPLARPRRRDR
jgi:hypothetical protein